MAAEQGHAEAQYQLGLMYFRGKGVTRDYDQARKWTRKAAEQDYAGAQFNMGIMFFKGKGVSQDYTQAHMWFSLAAANGYDKSHKSLDTVAKKMTPAEISEAQRLASEWLPSLRNDRLKLATEPAFALRGSDLGTVILLPTKDVKDTPTGR
jgi:TPR repeat protein